MKKRIEPTLVEKSIEAVPGFEQVFKKLGQQVTLRGQSQRYGIYSSRYKALKQKLAPKLTIKESSQERLLRLTGFDVYLCPFCKKGNMHSFE
jgi:hypothetical protein